MGSTAGLTVTEGADADAGNVQRCLRQASVVLQREHAVMEQMV
eukprot:CAMPEP_0175031958 /NCGR_PEP_ID=MMETSP0005-20121125/21134_1 /TAXON_ID=420556 /ORGANISM="Ochromonas sp., Strain CCMP1393" /LENGTH=42 /DNA_ID= /DNA_START= /DNA_END= /DNA_ORIENTATION=